MEENLPPGFRFHPTDEELITFYLTEKASDNGFTSKAIADVDLNKCEPWDLPGKASMGEKEWYFFSLRDRKYPTGLRTNRATEAGYWKTTGKDKEVYRAAGIPVGMKKTLVFYRGRAPRGEKSNWVMHEYRLENKNPCRSNKEEWVVCRVFQKSAAVKRPQQTYSQRSPVSTSDTNSIDQFGDVDRLPRPNDVVESSNNFHNITAQNYIDENSVNMGTNRNLRVNWSTVKEITPLPSLPWPSSLLNTNLTIDSLLLKAWQLRNCQQRESSSNELSLLTQGMSQFGSDLGSKVQASSSIIMSHQFGSELSPNVQASSSRVLDALPRPQQEQPFNLDSIW